MNYYNDNNREAAEWLRELIKAKAIPEGIIDERSITDVRSEDLEDFTQCHFFAGIGGWALAMRLAGWPEDKPVWTMSCPCQPFSCAGKGMGTDDDRHLWPFARNLVGQRRPPIVFGEQVASAAGREWFNGVSADLEKLAYASAAADLCAAGIGAPHIRQRLYWVANAIGKQADPANPRGFHSESGGGGAFGGLGQPDSTGRNAGQPAVTASRHGDSTESTGGSCWMGEPIQQGLEGQPRNGDRGNKPGRDAAQPDRPVTAASAVGRVGDAKHDGSHTPADNPPLQNSDRKNGGLHHGNAAGAWGNFDIIPCRDGKSRRVESGTFPLAHGVSGRVGLLRGYGNAIVPQLAAEFVQAVMESKL